MFNTTYGEDHLFMPLSFRLESMNKPPHTKKSCSGEFYIPEQDFASIVSFRIVRKEG
jgi:hypothetical protein